MSDTKHMALIEESLASSYFTVKQGHQIHGKRRCSLQSLSLEFVPEFKTGEPDLRVTDEKKRDLTNDRQVGVCLLLWVGGSMDETESVFSEMFYILATVDLSISNIVEMRKRKESRNDVSHTVSPRPLHAVAEKTQPSRHAVPSFYYWGLLRCTRAHSF
ncbi:hypothetical protein TGPRC2_288455 [Toxoplasma gondii TgCatPRC2]|uniref:Uncharacterized protein n=6 Tax=Toxoplasma gondii TaxID=5811 RepID=A0A151HJH5_TOXGO|nr:hypothetical protein TGME49_288455 [Toxoplasma gondii ME49]KFG62569.1 hypothetical protein TGRUB_288455 [Toxoplasma gondii RUB]KFH12149.1 hypothetical protein TGMAS_288455 [Toxoplasma gondii MAS]KYK69421.1 hypothetical protein TGPRC2_288455 [Toxoplasma gondii TgCatPRC2]PIM01786.1 hypothetical protein TGCOUG_288455 [Toxoplasma gondii COUG]EPT27850.1 hypothetical protein TGME49_288455 [Toxoplasma gondii ME49]|eukprot:XP_018636357.1 hypothetical protein TGME49_288455 [Toxoplasma gondii ME49]